MKVSTHTQSTTLRSPVLPPPLRQTSLSGLCVSVSPWWIRLSHARRGYTPPEGSSMMPCGSSRMRFSSQP
jgi:hypothetical protein